MFFGINLGHVTIVNMDIRLLKRLQLVQMVNCFQEIIHIRAFQQHIINEQSHFDIFSFWIAEHCPKVILNKLIVEFGIFFSLHLKNAVL